MDLNLTTFHLRLGVLACPLSASLLAQVKGRGGLWIKSQDVARSAVSQGRLPGGVGGNEVNGLRALFEAQALRSIMEAWLFNSNT